MHYSYFKYDSFKNIAKLYGGGYAGATFVCMVL